MKKVFFFCFTILFSTNHAWAKTSLNIRGGYGIQATKDKRYSESDLKDFKGLNIDAFVRLYESPFGFGLRYEDMNFKFKKQESEVKRSQLTKMSLLLNYRFIDSLFFVGGTGAIGFSNNLNVDKTFGDLKSANDLTYTVAVEAGVPIEFVSFSGELGYNIDQIYENKNNGATVNLGGLYFKFIVGIQFDFL